MTLTYLREKVDRGLSPLSTTRYLFERYLFARYLFDPAFGLVGHSSPVFPKWNPRLSGSWVHKPHLTVLEPMAFQACDPGWVPQENLEKTTHKTSNDFVGIFLIKMLLYPTGEV